jgi:type I restriction enzyme M protein
MPAPATVDEINSIVWQACDTFRGAVDPSEYKNYILVTLFLKYVSDLARDLRAEYATKYKGDEARVERAMAKERFVLPAESSFYHLHENRSAANIGELMNIALERLEDANKSKLEKVFRMIDFNSEANLGETRERNRRLKNLLEDFAKLDLSGEHLGSRDVIGDVYEYLIGKFAAGAGKEGGRVLHPARGVHAPRPPAQAQERHDHLRSRLRVRDRCSSRWPVRSAPTTSPSSARNPTGPPGRSAG